MARETKAGPKRRTARSKPLTEHRCCVCGRRRARGVPFLAAGGCTFCGKACRDWHAASRPGRCPHHGELGLAAWNAPARVISDRRDAKDALRA